MIQLPIDEHLPSIVTYLQQHSIVIVEAAPGTGKTTRIPPTLLKSFSKKILVLEPRRLAARLSAERVAEELTEKLGQSVGYQVRSEKKTTSETRLIFLTEGVFIRQLLHDPALDEVNIVIIDEFHERHVHTDVALAILLHLQKTLRPDLKVVIMSATLNTASLQTHIPQAKVIKCPGVTFSVAIEHIDISTPSISEPMAVTRAVRELIRDARCPGNILCFFAGLAEIHAAKQLLLTEDFESETEVHCLYADLDTKEQHKIFAPSSKRKIILATNVAETSVTIDNITGVVDTGFAYMSGYSPWNGFTTLEKRSISKAACIQRAGRAGRVAPGVAKRIYSSYDFQSRLSYEKPELLRSDLAQTVLELKVTSAQLPKDKQFDLETLPWLDSPSNTDVSACLQLLRWLGALDNFNNPTAQGKRMAQFPIHPRLSKFLLEAEQSAHLNDAIWIASALNEGMISAWQRHNHKTQRSSIHHSQSDVVAFFESLAPTSQLWSKLEQTAGQLSRTFGINKIQRPQFTNEATLNAYLLTSFPDQVAGLRQTGLRTHSKSIQHEWNLCLGGSAQLIPSSAAGESTFILAMDAVQNKNNKSNILQITTACSVDKQQLINSNSTFLNSEKVVEWDAQFQKIKACQRTCYGKLILEEVLLQPQEFDSKTQNEGESVMLNALQKSWPQPFKDVSTTLQSILSRIDIIKMHDVTFTAPEWIQHLLNETFNDDVILFLSFICEKKRSFTELENQPFFKYLNDFLDPSLIEALDSYAPEKVKLASGRHVDVHYEPNKLPWLAGRMQDFYGTLSSPPVGKGRLKPIIHLLSPNSQVVQITADLKGFWEKDYPSVRRELLRRYPKHFWPEDPKTEPARQFSKKLT